MLPCDWSATPYHNDGFPTAWDGPTGFVIFGIRSDAPAGTNTTPANEPMSSCQSDADHLLHPFGSRPNVTMTSIHGHPACRIRPSADAPPQTARANGPGFAWNELVIEYLVPVDDGQGGHGLTLSVIADGGHLDTIAAQMAFDDGN